jgi:hypothetical protein
VGHFERFRGSLNTFSKNWRVLFRNLRLSKDIFTEVKAYLNQYEGFLKIMRLFEDVSRKMEASV